MFFRLPPTFSLPADWSVNVPGGEEPRMSETERECAWAPRGQAPWECTHTCPGPGWHRCHCSPPSQDTQEESKDKTRGQGGAKARDSLLPSFPDYCDPLTVFCPSNVLDLPSKRLILIL